MTNARLFAAVGAAALLAGGLLWHFGRPARVARTAPATVVAIAPTAIYAATFTDAAGNPRALGQFQGKVVVINFWATWCEPCRAEMPAFQKLHERWAGRGVHFVGISDESPEKAGRFGRELGIGYPLWTGGDQVADLSRRLGNGVGGLPHTVILGRTGEVLDQRVGPYTEKELDATLLRVAGNSG